MSDPGVSQNTVKEKTSWIHKGFALLFIIFCMELGLFLIVYPWTDKWEMSLVPAMISGVRNIWLNGYFRGVISGLGVLNLWIAFTEIFRLKRFGSSDRA